ncbi:MAG: acylneuraminate cytidylyltransferase family protein [Candidatus Nitrosopelagicus sp.]|nr:acylneuraminate cytidylyltransferase family protein [Candidatus Nitrosopelagicus sp.]
MKVLAIIPARGGSKGIPLKNLRLLNGKPLLDYSVNASLQSKFITRTIVSSDHSKILQRATKLGAEIIKRPKHLATDASHIEPVIDYCLNFLKLKEDYCPDIIILLQNTSPLRTKKHVDDALNIFLSSKYDSMLSGYYSHHFFWRIKNSIAIPMNYIPKKRPNRQDFDYQFIENGAIYITKYSTFKKSKCRISGKIGFFEMNEGLSIDIDTELDLKQANQKIKKLKI